MPFFYRRDGARFVPSELSSSPWEEGKQNGAALGGLLAHLIDGVAAAGEMTTARLVVDILAAAAFAPLEGRTRIVRDGRRIQLVEAELLVGATVVARATALRVRTLDTPPVEPDAPYPPPEDFSVPYTMRHRMGQTLDSRRVSGSADIRGPGAIWVRFGHEHVEGVPLTPLVRTVILADFSSGLSGVLPLDRWFYPNLDITLLMTRAPEGEWLLLDSRTTSAGLGVGLVSAVIADRRGPFGRTHQTIFVAPAG